MIEFTSIQQMLEETSSSGLPLWDAIRQADCQRQGISPQQSWDKMAAMLQAMEDADRSYQETDRSHSGLSGGDGGKMARYIRAGKPLCGPFLSEVMAGALRMGECNACMKRIVAAPTAGACGVLPAVAMAAPALVHLQGGTPEQMANACAMAVKNLLGLVCDPVGGLVEVPCVKRNVIGAMDALSAAQMALAGIESRVPPDQVLDAMREVGQSLPHTLRETGKGGLAATPFGLRYTPKEADKR